MLSNLLFPTVRLLTREQLAVPDPLMRSLESVDPGTWLGLTVMAGILLMFVFATGASQPNRS